MEADARSASGSIGKPTKTDGVITPLPRLLFACTGPNSDETRIQLRHRFGAKGDERRETSLDESNPPGLERTGSGSGEEKWSRRTDLNGRPAHYE